MKTALQLIGEYISKCASCPHNYDGECGFVNAWKLDEEEQAISPEQYEEMTSEELELFNSKIDGRSCSKQKSNPQLMSEIEMALDNSDYNPSHSEIIKIVTLCHKYWNEVKRYDGSIDNFFNDTVEKAINIVLSYLDLRCLENGKDIMPILDTYVGRYTRERGLDRYCPEAISNNYLKTAKQYDINGEIKATHSFHPSVPEPADGMEGATDYQGQLTAKDQFMALFASDDAIYFIEAIFALHNFNLPEHYNGESEHNLSFYLTSIDKAEKFIFHRWGELREEISSRIKAFKYRDEELTEYLKSLLVPTYNTFLHLFPKGNDLEHREARFMLDVFATTCVTSIDYFKDIWMECRAEAKRYVDNFVGGDDNYMEQIENLIHQKHKAFIPYNGCKESWALFNIRSAIFRFIFTVEGCLIENMTEMSIFDYQEKFDTPMVGKITDLDLCLSMDWSVCMVDYYLSMVGHDIETLPSEDYKNVLEWATTYSQHDFYEPEQIVVEEAEEDDGHVTSEEEHVQEDSAQNSEETDIQDSPKTALQELLDMYVETGEMENFIEANLLYIGLDPYSPNYEVREGNKNAENTIKKFKDSYSVNGFFRLEELKDEISSGIHLRKEDDCQLEHYVCSLLEPFQTLMFYFFPQDQDLFCSVCKETIDLLLHAPGSTFEDFSKDIIDSVHEIKIEHAKDKVSVTEFAKLLHDKYYEKQNGSTVPIICPEKNYIEKFVNTLNDYAGIIEGALLENGVGKSLLYYQDFCGVKICDKLDIYKISENIGWTYTRVESAIKKYHHEEIKDDKTEPAANGPSSENVDSKNSLHTGNNEKPFTPPRNVGKSKCAATKDRLICHKVNLLCTELIRKNYAKREEDGKITWIEDKNAYAYFCYKLTEGFVGSETEIEMKFISENLITYPGNLETLANYANKYKKGLKSKPDLAFAIDNLINSAKKGILG